MLGEFAAPSIWALWFLSLLTASIEHFFTSSLMNFLMTYFVFFFCNLYQQNFYHFFVVVVGLLQNASSFLNQMNRP